MSKVAILGYGTVGSGVVEVLSTNQKSINKKAESEIELKYVLDLREFPGTPIESVLTHDYNEILNDDEIEVIAEVMGGIEPAYTFVKKALERNKSVVTSNKELVAMHGPELLEIAKAHKVNFLFEASVGGGIPIIRPLTQSLTADEIYEISGILNGTTNFILTKMKEEGLDFEKVLREAQDLGYAELHPEADIEGYDACRKIAILSSLAFGRHVDFEDIYTEGITKITQKDMTYAKKMGMEIKLIGQCKKVDNQVYSMVAPMFLNPSHPLSNVHGVFNAILIKGNVIGEVMFYGAGAGKLPTASAVVADIIDAVKHKGKNIITKWSTKPLELMSIEEVMFRFYIRLKVTDRKALKERVAVLIGDVQWVEIEEEKDTISLITLPIKEGRIKDLIEALALLDSVETVESMIRMES